MKPTFNDEKQQESMEMITPSYTQINSKKWILRLTVGIVSLLVIAGVIFAAVYFGTKITHNNFEEIQKIQEYHGRFHLPNGNITEETIILTNMEVELVLDTVAAIFDFKTGLVVYKVTDEKRSMKGCYVSSFNKSEMQTPAQMREQMPGSEFDMSVNGQTIVHYEVTDIWFNKAALGPRSKTLCSGRNVFVVRKVNGNKRQKRGVLMTIAIVLIFFPISVG